MEIHIPKLWHGWREFLREYAIIVVGVLTALGAEQIAENVHWSRRLDEMHNQVRAELSGNVQSGIVWLAVAPCYNQELNDLKLAISEARKTGLFVPSALAYAPTLVQFKSDAWLNARALQVSDHLSLKEAQDFSDVYFYATQLRENMIQMHEQAAGLSILWEQLDRITPAESDALGQRVRQAIELQRRTQLALVNMLHVTFQMGIEVPVSTQAYAEQLREQGFGTCMSSPKAVEAVFRRDDVSKEGAFELLHLGKLSLF